LHRSLKPKEEVVRDIVGEYQEKASLLLENMRARHHQEKSETLSSLWKASSGAFTVFSIAEQEMKIIIDRLHDLDMPQTLASFKRTDLMEKLDTVARLCQARASNYTANETRAGSEAHENEGSNETDGGTADTLVENYRLKLEDGIRQPDDETSAAYRQLSAEADMFITQCLQGGRRDDARPDARPSKNTEKKTKTANRTTDEALEDFLDRIINTLQESTADGGSSHPSCDDDRKII
jgi:3-phosphoglycerate kinase